MPTDVTPAMPIFGRLLLLLVATGVFMRLWSGTEPPRKVSTISVRRLAAPAAPPPRVAIPSRADRDAARSSPSRSPLGVSDLGPLGSVEPQRSGKPIGAVQLWPLVWLRACQAAGTWILQTGSAWPLESAIGKLHGWRLPSPPSGQVEAAAEVAADLPSEPCDVAPGDAARQPERRWPTNRKFDFTGYVEPGAGPLTATIPPELSPELARPH